MQQLDGAGPIPSPEDDPDAALVNEANALCSSVMRDRAFASVDAELAGLDVAAVDLAICRLWESITFHARGNLPSR